MTAPTGTARRDYAAPLARLRSLRAPARDAAMQAAVDALWDAFHPRGLSWIGFYEKTPGKDEMTLLARRDKPACSPLGLHGICGRCWSARRPILVRDVATLGAGYIACDPRDKSEAVIPLFDPDGSCWGVLDADSFETGCFDDADIAGLTACAQAAGLSAAPAARPATLHL